MTLPRKQAATTEEFWTALGTIRDRYPLARLEALADQAVATIRDMARTERLAYAWSGGKDSVVLGYLAERAGVRECVLVITDLEYPEFLGWATDNMPQDLEVVNTGQDLPWLAKHPAMLFPMEAQTAARWFRVVQHTGQRDYFRKHGLDGLLLGRRWADGNYTGPKGEVRYQNREGVTRISPIANWTHEDVLASIAWFDLPLAPNYGWPRGFRVGTGPWPARQWCGTVERGWREVYAIDPEIVREASRLIPSARTFLDG